MANTFTTRTQVVNWLVEQGKPLAHAKVAIDQGFNFDIDGATDDACRRMDDDYAEGAMHVLVTEQDALSVYNDFCGPDGYYNVTDQGFVFDGDDKPSYDLKGDHL